LHPALAFGSALGGAALLGAVGAVLALPGAAMAQALISELGTRHEVIDSELTDITDRRRWRRPPRFSNSMAPMVIMARRRAARDSRSGPPDEEGRRGP